jgi:hypothetical protein
VVGLETRLKLVQVVRKGEVERVEAGEQERLEQVRLGTCRVAAD